MPVLVASKFEEDLTEKEHHFFHHSRALHVIPNDFMPVVDM